MGRPKPHTAALRVRLLDRAADLLSSEGPQALSLRRLATDVLANHLPPEAGDPCELFASTIQALARCWRHPT